MRDQPAQVVSLTVTIKDQPQSFVLNVDRGAVGPQQRLFVYADRGGIKDRLPVLGLRKQKYEPTRAGSGQCS